MDRLWTPWRYNYITGGDTSREAAGRKGVPPALAAWPGPTGQELAEGVAADCVFCNLIGAVRWAERGGMPAQEAERAGLVLARHDSLFVCLNAFPYSSGHVLLVPYRHAASLTQLSEVEAAALMLEAQRIERALRDVYRPDGINLGMNLGEAAGAGVAGHLHLHALPRWFGDTSFITTVAETRVLPETLETTWQRLRDALERTACGV